MGISVISKNTKKSSRSSATKTPSRPVSRISMRAMYIFGRSVIDADAATEIGNRIAVRTISSSEMPSIPTFQPIPHGSYQTTCSVNWKPASPVVNSHRMYRATASGGIVMAKATGITNSVRDDGIAITARAPSTGSRTSSVISGIRNRPRSPG